MRIQAAANRFNQMPCHDGYTGVFLFNAQLNLFDDVRNDSEAAERRIMSLAPNTLIPVRRVIEAGGVWFILGHRNADSFHGTTIRDGYVVHEAPELTRIRTLGEMCRDELGFTAYAGNAWIKNLAWVEQSSHMLPQQHLHYASSEIGIKDDMIVLYGPRKYIIRTTHLGPGGTLVATSDEMVEPVTEIAQIQSDEYDPITDTVGGTSVPVRIVRVRWQSLFRYRNNMAPKFSAEDIQVAIARDVVTVRPGARLVMSDGNWVIASVSAEDDVWLCRAVQHD